MIPPMVPDSVVAFFARGELDPFGKAALGHVRRQGGNDPITMTRASSFSFAAVAGSMRHWSCGRDGLGHRQVESVPALRVHASLNRSFLMGRRLRRIDGQRQWRWCHGHATLYRHGNRQLEIGWPGSLVSTWMLREEGPCLRSSFFAESLMPIVTSARSPGGIGPFGSSIVVQEQELGPRRKQQRHLAFVADDEGMLHLRGRFNDAGVVRRLVHHGSGPAAAGRGPTAAGDFRPSARKTSAVTAMPVTAAPRRTSAGSGKSPS